ncbi:MAG: hypothetical protein JO019_02395 [Candidatus Kaiserbacteria bacterium]|nr:hypothetical protein [Candidatus Kaiserbacteria bacterium]
MAVRVFLLGIVAFALMSAFEYYGLVKDLFLTNWWIDLPIHFFGGVWAAAIAAWFILMSRQRPDMVRCIVFVALCGIAIEVLEFFSGMRGSYFPYPIDTVKDVIVDLIGGYAGFALMRHFLLWQK